MVSLPSASTQEEMVDGEKVFLFYLISIDTWQKDMAPHKSFGATNSNMISRCVQQTHITQCKLIVSVFVLCRSVVTSP